MAGAASSTQEADRQIQVRFTTKLPPKLRVPSTAFAVPARLTRYGLSEVVNTLLGCDPPRPFDFIVQPSGADVTHSLYGGQELLRTSLENLLISRGLSAESVLSLEYIPAQAPPEFRLGSPHEDWVSAVDGSADGFVVTGSYDAVGTLWRLAGAGTDAAFRRIARLRGAMDVVTKVARVPAGVHELEADLLVVASKDRSLYMYKPSADILAKEDEADAEVHPFAVLRGHSAAVQGVAVGPSGRLLCSSGWDKTVRVWRVPTGSSADMDQEAELPAAITKKRRVNGNGDVSASTDEPREVQPEKTLEAHSQCVSAVAWGSSSSLWSASWDHFLRQWDVESGVNTLSFHTSKALHCISLSHDRGKDSSAALVASGGADFAVSIWDPRDSKKVTATMLLASHKGWVTGVAWNPQNTVQLLSCSHDGTLKLWDTRSKIPLHTIKSHADKVLCVDWWRKGRTILSGGVDCKLYWNELVH